MENSLQHRPKSSHLERRTKKDQYGPTSSAGKRSCTYPYTSGRNYGGSLDLADSLQWSTVTNTKSKGKAKTSSCNVVCISSRETETDVPSLTDSEEETIVLAAELNKLLVTETSSGQSYLKKYDEMMASPPKPTAESAKPFAKHLVEKQKELSFPRLSQRTTRKDPQHLTALTSWLNWPISRPGSPFTSS